MFSRLCKTCLKTKGPDDFRARFQECKECVVARTRRWRLENKERHWYQYRGNYLKRYGMSFKDFSALVELNGDVCIVCSGREVAFKELHVDHDHSVDTGHAVRGLLCDRCNQLLGKVKDSPGVLNALADYLERLPPTLCPATPRPPRKRPDTQTKKGVHREAVIDAEGNRECRVCKKYLPPEDYFRGAKYICKSCTASWGASWRAANPEAFAASRRRVTLRTKFGITPEQSADLLQRQGGVCAACRKPDATGRALCHDHIHGVEGKPIVRGLLCTLCNFAEGSAKSSPTLLRALAKYILLSVGRPERWWLVPKHARGYKNLRSTPSALAPQASTPSAV